MTAAAAAAAAESGERDVRRVLLVAHTGREAVRAAAALLVERLAAVGIAVCLLPEEAADLDLPGTQTLAAAAPPADGQLGADGRAGLGGIELIVVLGGDGTILRAAELSRQHSTPLLGVNLGRVGFLAEAEREALGAVIERVAARQYVVEERMTLDLTVSLPGGADVSGWALNEVSIEKQARERMIELLVEVDGRPLSRWAADGVIVATPTGSTAYAFSAGGPVVWPEVEALLLIPISAHALFSRAMVTAPGTLLAVEVLPESASHGVAWCDGRRVLDLPPSARIEVRRGSRPVRLARLHAYPFTDRLVAKFGLPVHGWRGPAH